MSGLDGLADVVEAWRGDAALFVSDQFGIEPTEQQKLLLRAASKPGAHVAVKSGHGTGKSTAMAWLILWALCCWEDVKIPCTAPTAHQLEDILWPEVEKWRPRMLEPWRSSVTVTKDTVKMTGLPGFAVARTGRKENPEALQGFHAENLLFLVDEASGIPDQVFEVARGALSTPDARVIMRICLDVPEWWEEKHPEGCCQLRDGTTRRQSFSSSVWLASVGDVLRKIVEWIAASEYAPRFVGIHVAAGRTEEWFPHFYNEPFFDANPERLLG